jgi:hypothetical protein
MGPIVGAVLLSVGTALWEWNWTKSVLGSSLAALRRRTIVFVTIFCAIAVSCVFVNVSNSLCAPQSDSELIDNFNRHRIDFCQLERMARASGPVSIAGRYSTIAHGPYSKIPKPLLGRYQALMTAAKITHGIGANAGSEDNFYTYSTDELMSGSSTAKGYAYVRTAKERRQ